MIRIGTRKSKLALWQANEVRAALELQGHSCELVLIESNGDQDLNQPLYAMGIQGIFTKTLDTAILNKKIDIAVHSLKDVPTLLPKGIQIKAVLSRGNPMDVLVYNTSFNAWETDASIGTGSLRRRAQWLRKYPNHKVENLRGNLQKRLEKLNNSEWSGAVFAQAGLERLDLLKVNHEVLEWMLPAPSQGIVGIACMETNRALQEVLEKINCTTTAKCAHIERSFLNTLEGGCTAPIGAHAYFNNDKLYFKGGLFSLDGTIAILHEEATSSEQHEETGIKAAHEILNKGGKELMHQIKSQL
ncbi:MAG: hydroxymethylbilane synthase [Flavobacteriaceae bacterium]|nr:hydroxymethylbilane synthase [Flavobacteriaceae bacterium]MDG2503379.1 hydroxymethylbilane synthase [Flavobacteriaceae bacterium]